MKDITTTPSIATALIVVPQPRRQGVSGVELPAAILSNECKLEFLPDLVGFIRTACPAHGRQARVKLELETLAALPSEMGAVFQVGGISFQSKIYDIEIIYLLTVAARAAQDEAERDYAASVRSWIDERTLNEDAISDGADACPLVGVRPVAQ